MQFKDISVCGSPFPFKIMHFVLYCQLLDGQKQIVKRNKIYDASLDGLSVKLIQMSI